MTGIHPGEMWKRWLWRDLRELIADMEGGNWAESASYRAAVVERFMFVSAYVVRKLYENDELTEELREMEWPVKRFDCIRHPPHTQQFRVAYVWADKDWFEPVEDYYDCKVPRDETLKLASLCNLVIHHFAFEVRSKDANGVYIYFNADRSKAELIYLIDFATWVAFIDEAAHDETVFFTHDEKANRPRRHRVQRHDLI